MQPPKDEVRLITLGDDLHPHIDLAVTTMAKAVGSTYGPGGRPVLIKKRYVEPMLSTDGVTVARNIAGHGFKMKGAQPAADAARLIYQASEKTNKTAGDGTTATVVLLEALYKSGYKQIAAGVDAMVLKRKIDDAREQICQFIESKSLECDKQKLDQVAITSGKDEALGHLISDLVWEMGADGTTTIEYQNAPHVEVEKVTGYLFGSGFRHLAVNEVELNDPLVFVSQKRLAAKGDIIPLLELIHKSKEAFGTERQFVLIADVSGPALETLVYAIQNQMVDGLSIQPPAFGADGHDYFVDIATYTGAKLILESDNFKDVTYDHSGSIKKARIGRDKSTLYGDNHTGNKIADRIAEIKKQMKGDISPSMKEQLEGRLAKLSGKVAIIKVGAATEVEREELFFRVEDAVEACKSALSSGIVAGGATTLLFASEMKPVLPVYDADKIHAADLDLTSGEVMVVSDVDAAQYIQGNHVLPRFIREALQQPFQLLMSNAAERGEYRLEQVLKAGYGYGFDLKHMTDEPVDMLENGTVDAAKVVLQTVKNAFSVAGGLLSAGGSISEDESNEEAK
jgi:chaperonin GroEL